MAEMKYFLVTNSTAKEIEKFTGLRGHDTPYGALVERPKPFRIEVAMEEFNLIFHPKLKCTCGRGFYAWLHKQECPLNIPVT